MKSLFLSTRILRLNSPSKRPQRLHPYRREFCAYTSAQLAVVSEVLGIIELVTPMEQALERVAPFVTPHIVSSVLEEKKGELELAFRFFIWAMQRKHLRSWVSQNLVVDMLVRYGNDKRSNLEGFDLYWKILDEARECGRSVDSGAFTPLIIACWRIRKAEMALETFNRMREFNCEPDVHAFNMILHVAVKKDVILLAMSVYNVILKKNCQPNCCTFNILIDGLCKGGKTQDALNLFDEMSEKGIAPNKVTYTVILSGLCQAKRADDAYRLFNLMKRRGYPPDDVTYNALLNGFCKLGRIDEAFGLLKSFKNDGFSGTLNSYSSLVDGLIRANRIDEAHEIFQKLFEFGKTPDVVLYTTMIRGLCQAARINDALNLLTDMTERGIAPDTHCYNTLIKGYCDMGLLDRAKSLKLEISKQELFPDTCTYTILICGMCRHGLVGEAQNIFNEMEKLGCFPSIVTFNSLMDGLCKAGELEEAQLMLYKMEIGRNPSLFLRLSQGADRVLDSTSLQAMVEKLCDSGLILKAYKLLMQLADSGVVPNIITYNILINGFCKAGNISGAIKLFEDLQLKRHSPDKITYGTIIDGLQRAGREEDAFKVFDQMSKSYCTPGSEVYKSLMTWSCRKVKISLAFDLYLKYLKDVRGEEGEKIRSVEKHVKEGNLEMAVQELLEIDLLSQSFDSAPYTIWLIGLCQAQRAQEALKIFSILGEHGINVSGPSCVMLIHSLCCDGNLDQAINVFLYTVEKGFRLMPRICNNLLMCLLQSEEKAESAFYLLKEMKSMGYNLDAYLYGGTKSLLSHRSKSMQVEYVLHE